MISGKIVLFVGIGMIIVSIILFIVSVAYGRIVSHKLKDKIYEEY